MNDTRKAKDMITTLCSLPGVSGYETPVAEALKEAWSGLADEFSISRLGNLYALKKADTAMPGKPRKVLFATHIDGIGMIVSDIIGEFLRFAPAGGFDPRILPGQFVDIHTKSGKIRGLIVMPGGNLTKEQYGTDPIPLHELFIDTGYTAEELKTLVRIGDMISFANEPVDMQDGTISAHSLDNRASVAAVTFCLQELQTIRHKWDVYAVGTVMEEVSLAGGYTAPFDIRPDIAVAIDVTFATGPGSKDWNTRPLGSGASISFGMNIHPALYDLCTKICNEENIPYTTELITRGSGTDANGMQITAGGIYTIVISVPLRYMHTANEVISIKDVQAVGRLLAAFVRTLDENTMDQLSWEDYDERI